MFGIDDFLGMNHWLAASIVYITLALFTFIPVVTAKLKKVRFEKEIKKVEDMTPEEEKKQEKEKKRKEGLWYRFWHRNDRVHIKDPFESSVFKDDEKKRLNNHFRRMEGALVYWKYRAEWNRLFHYYTLGWTLLISLLIPVLLTFVTVEGFAQMFLIIISLHSAIMLGFHRMLKIENNYKAFKYGKSEFCDLYRRMLDRPESFGDDLYEDVVDEAEIKRIHRQWIDEYFEEAELIRRTMRLVEIDNIPGTEDKWEESPPRKPRKIDEQLPPGNGKQTSPEGGKPSTSKNDKSSPSKNDKSSSSNDDKPSPSKDDKKTVKESDAK